MSVFSSGWDGLHWLCSVTPSDVVRNHEHDDVTGWVAPNRIWLPALLLGTAAMAVAAILMLMDPHVLGSVLPSCPFHRLTGLFCPGCGTTRALHALLHGNFALALGMNPLAVVAVTMMPALLWNTWHPHRMWMARVSDARIWLVLVMAFAVLRNLPWEPFIRLAPG